MKRTIFTITMVVAMICATIGLLPRSSSLPSPKIDERVGEESSPYYFENKYLSSREATDNAEHPAAYAAH